MSMMVVMPPAAAARVAVAKPSRIGPSRPVDVHVRVHEPRQQYLVSGELGHLSRPGRQVERAHLGNQAASHHDGRRPDAIRRHHPHGAHQQVAAGRRAGLSHRRPHLRPAKPVAAQPTFVSGPVRPPPAGRLPPALRASPGPGRSPP